MLFKPGGSEITRLPGEAEPEQAMELLRLGLAGGRPVKAMLAELAVASAPAGADAAARLWLKAAAASNDGKSLKADEALRERVRKLLAGPAQVRLQADVIVNRAPEVVRTRGDSDESRQPFVALFEPALRRLRAKAGLSRGDRLSALASCIELARIDAAKGELRPPMPDALLREVRDHTADVDRDITYAYEHQAVMRSVAYALERAGLWSDGEALLLANLRRSVSPYNLMSQLGWHGAQAGPQR